MKVYDRKHKQYVEVKHIINMELKFVESKCWIVTMNDKPMIFVNCSCTREEKNGKIQIGGGIFTLFNKLIKPNQWFEIPGFLESYLEFKERYTRIVLSGMFTKDVVQKQLKKFERKLSSENKLLLEVSN